MATSPPHWEVYLADAFTGPGLRGNPAAVVLLDAHPSDETMQAFAATAGHSETAFVALAGSDPRSAHVAIRFFGPRVEMPQCGHATLAAAAVLFATRALSKIHFHTKAGIMTASRDGSSVRLDFPEDPGVPISPMPKLLKALGVNEAVGARYSPRSQKLLIHLSSHAIVRDLAPDFDAMLAARHEPQVKGVIVTAPGHGPHDFVSRYFNPWVGVNEDPVTGNAHCVLAPYWGALLRKTTLLGLQISARGGQVGMALLGNGRVTLQGEVTLHPPARGPKRHGDGGAPAQKREKGAP